MNTPGAERILTLSLEPPSLADNTADADRLAGALARRLETDRVDLDLSLFKMLPSLLRQADYRLKCILTNDRGRWALIHAVAADDPAPVAGLAVDLGTTRISMRLLDLATGSVLNESSFLNPQTTIGSDILTRIHYAEKESGLAALNAMLISAVNRETASLCAHSAVTPQNIHLFSLAGNPAMTHFAMGLSPYWMIREPYIPVINRPGFIPAEQLGIGGAPRAKALIFPNVGSYFGGDLIAGILFAGLHRQDDISLLVDVGTNAEVVLGNRDWMIACAGAAGPALEGGVTQMGMLAGPGVIDGLSIDPKSKDVQLHTVDDLPPIGICGSGLIELAAALFLAGMIDTRGRFIPAACAGRLKKIGAVSHLIVAPGSQSASGRDLLISQTDLDSLIRSKAAMYSILETITAQVDLPFCDLAHFYVAGTFGTFIKPEAAISIGMLPDLPLDRFVPLGNSSLGGATLALRQLNILEEIDAIKDRITYLELNVNQKFMNRFSAARFLPHTDQTRFPSVAREAIG